jgi:SMODS-associated and fused to various effectors sensor domain
MNPPTRLLILQGISSLRITGEQEVLAALSPDEVRLPRTIMPLDTRHHTQSIQSGFWPPVELHVREFAAQVLANLEEQGSANVRYVGIDEVPTLIALGALLGDEHRIGCHDYDRDRERFEWPEATGALAWQPVGVPREVMPTAGDAVLRIAATGTVHDAHVEQAIPTDQRVADVTVRPVGVTPHPGLLRAQDDVESLRQAVREVLAELDRTRPGIQTIHLFLAGPVSVCLAVGQELRLRNGRRVQTYRYRTQDVPAQKEAILLTPEAGAAVQAPLTEEERAQAVLVRNLWREALAQVIAHAMTLRGGVPWPRYLLPVLADAGSHPIPLAPIWELVGETDGISDDDTTDFRFDRTGRQWYFPDRMLVAMGADVGVDDERVRRLARAFFWHEYLHEYQLLTEHTATGIGSFANCLERVDYVADAYGTLHQVDYLLRVGGTSEPSDSELRVHLWASITEAIEAFWTFEPRPPVATWQARRLRRYLNWYWRRQQIHHSGNTSAAIALLCRPPVIEVVGPTVSTDSQRVILNLRRIHTDRLELAVIDESNRLRRFANSPTLSVAGLLDAFRMHDRLGIDRFFENLIDHARDLA